MRLIGAFVAGALVAGITAYVILARPVDPSRGAPSRPNNPWIGTERSVLQACATGATAFVGGGVPVFADPPNRSATAKREDSRLITDLGPWRRVRVIDASPAFAGGPDDVKIEVLDGYETGRTGWIDGVRAGRCLWAAN
jgi:hypothetical protein